MPNTNFIIIPHLKGRGIVLASASPRRREILSKIATTLLIYKSDFPEDLDKSQFPTPKDYCERNAKEKANNVLKRSIMNDCDNFDYLIACDTIVCIDGKILEKPANVKENLEMLQLLNGREHSVISSLYMINLKNQEKIFCGSDETVVKFHQLPLEYLQNYANSEDGLDKAGGYGYQAWGKFLVKEIRGCYYNIVGFPMSLFMQVIIEKRID